MSNERALTGGLMIAVPLVFTAAFTGLQMTFEYPDILRHPAAEVLTRFAAAGPELHLFWYGMMAASLAFIPAAIVIAMHYRKTAPLAAAMSAGFGILAGLVQALGLLRWVIVIPSIAANFTAAGATEVDKAVATGLFDFANTYIGMGVGEHLGYLFTALWTVTLAVLFWNRFRLLAIAAIAIAAGVAVGMLEPFGVEMAGAINSISFTLWAIWALVFGVVTLVAKHKPEPVGMLQPA